MSFFVALFNPDTYRAFSDSSRDISGHPRSVRRAASRVRPGDTLICYVTGWVCWVGVLEVLSECYEDHTPVFRPHDDEFVIRFKVRTAAWLHQSNAVSMHEEEVWSGLAELTRGLEKGSGRWAVFIRPSLRRLPDSDGQFLKKLIIDRSGGPETAEVSLVEPERASSHRVREAEKLLEIPAPVETVETPRVTLDAPPCEVRDSTQVQARLARIGIQMGMKIWIPTHDRAGVISLCVPNSAAFLDVLPLNYEEQIQRTVEQIDVLWLRERVIVRAFEVEHSTSVYSGILRMADLLALQPNMDIKLHLVAPDDRREKVFQELRRPVFAQLGRKPLAKLCTFLSYSSVEKVAKLPHLRYLSDAVLDEYAEAAQ